MAQFDVHPNPDHTSRTQYPFVVCLQSGLLADRASQVVAPLVPHSGLATRTGRLAPVVTIDDAEYAVLVTSLETLPGNLLPHRIANLSSHREALLGAVDLLFYGV
jgi:toxin CcdB